MLFRCEVNHVAWPPTLHGLIFCFRSYGSLLLYRVVDVVVAPPSRHSVSVSRETSHPLYVCHGGFKAIALSLSLNGGTINASQSPDQLRANSTSVDISCLICSVRLLACRACHSISVCATPTPASNIKPGNPQHFIKSNCPE